MKKCRYRSELVGLESIAHHTFAFCLSLADCALLRSEATQAASGLYRRKARTHKYVACAVFKLLIRWGIDQEDKQEPGFMTFQLLLRTHLGFKILHPTVFRTCHA